MIKHLAGLALGSLVLPIVACQSGSEGAVGIEELSSRRPLAVIYDTDMDFDDASALALLCQEHKQGRIELVGVTVNNNGAGFPGNALQHARCVLQACGLSSVPIADGANTGVNPAPPELRFAIDGVLSGALASCTVTPRPATETPAQLISRVSPSNRDVMVISTGPLTNLADAIAASPSLSHRIDHVVAMGGALWTSGNLFGTGSEGFDNTQEFNIWIDPASADAVIDTFQGEFDLVPLDATNQVPITPAFVARLGADRTTPEANLVYNIVTQPITSYGISLGLFYWWDPLAVIAAVRNDDIVEFERARVAVVQEGPSQGRIVTDRRGYRIEVATEVDTPEFETTFINALNARRPGRSCNP